jgi:hypothetical protein
MPTSKVDGWVWVCVYLGMIVLGLGIATARTARLFGWAMAGIGVLLVIVGAVLVWTRSRMKLPP